MDSEEVQPEETYHWDHPLKSQLEKGLRELWKTPFIKFDSLDGSCPKQVTVEKEPVLPKAPPNGTSEERLYRKLCPVKPVPYKLNPITKLNPNNYCSLLQFKHLEKLTPMDDRMKRYFRAISILEYEHDHGSLTDNDFETTMIGESCWIPSEKKRFFLALERCGKGNVKEIAQRVGPTKTIAEVMEYLKVLQLTSKGIGKLPIRHLTAREMSPIYIAQEQYVAELIQDKLQVESYGKSLDYLNEPQHELFELWNMSSLTQMFSGINDMTLLTSSTINFHQLIKNFVSDIIIDLHTELLKTTDKTVSRKLMNYIIAKRERKIEPDRRLKQLNICLTLDKQYSYHRLCNTNRSASFLAKKRRALPDIDDNGREMTVPPRKSSDNFREKNYDDSGEKKYDDSREKNYDDSIEENSSDSGKEDSDDEEYNSSEDEMLKKIDTYDELNDTVRDTHVVKDVYHRYYLETMENALNPIEEKAMEANSSDEEENESDYEEKEEAEMQKLDTIHEEELIKYLEFYDEKTILNTQIPSFDEQNVGPETFKKRRLQ